MKTMTGFDTSDPNFDPVKYIRQLRCVINWMRKKARGTVEAATGFGKTTIGFITMSKIANFKANNSSSIKHGGSTLIVVPTTKLKEQWIKNLTKSGYQNFEVQVINTVSLSEGFARQVDLLIIDEVHLMAADKFKRIFGRVKYSWLLGLTATLERLDGKHYILEKVAPICDRITQKEAIEKGWISDFIEFNLAVPITDKEARKQVNLGKQIRYYMSKFQNGFDDMLYCMNKKNATNYANRYNLEIEDVNKWAVQGIRLIHERKKFLDTTKHKIEAAVELIEEFGVRTITFSQSTMFANEVAKRLGKKCKLYHSNIESEMRHVKKEKLYKTEKGAKRYYDSLVDLDYKPTIRKLKKGFKVVWKELKSISGNKIASENIESFIEGKSLILASAKALDQGFDVPDVLLGVDGSRSENPTQHTQRTGRVARNYTFSDGIKATKVYVNLYIPDWSVQDSIDERKLKQCQRKNAENVIWVDDLEELKSNLKTILKKRGKTKTSDSKTSFATTIEG